MSPKRVDWEALYGIQFTSAITGTETFVTGSGLKGIDLEKFGMLLTNHPDFDPGKTIIDTRKSVGVSQRVGGTGFEYQAEREVPIVSLEMEPGRKALGAFMWLLMQKGVIEGAPPAYKKTCTPYLTEASGGAVPEVYCSLIKDYGGGATAAEHHLIRGAICRSISLSGSEGGAIKMTAEMIGGDFLNTFTEGGGGGYSLAFATDAPILFKDLTFTLVASNIALTSFDITISNNAVSKSYNSGATSAYILKTVTCTGSLAIPWSETGAISLIDNHLGQTLSNFILSWGVGGTDLFKITVNGARISSAPTDLSGDEAVLNIGWEAVKSGTANGFQVEVEDQVNRGIT